MRTVCFLENDRLFDKNMGIRALISPWKIGKDGRPIDFLDPTYSVVDRIDVSLTKYGLDRNGFFIKSLKKKRNENTVFFREWRFF